MPVSDSTRHRYLRRRKDRLDARQKSMETSLKRWLVKLGRLLTIKMGREYGLPETELAKAPEFPEMQNELKRILLRFGLQQAGDAANEIGIGLAGKKIVSGSDIRAAIAGKPNRIKWFYELIDGVETRHKEIMQTSIDAVRQQVKEIVFQAQAEEPQLSAGGVARRIRQTIFTAPDDERMFAFSSTRASLIARTELVQAYSAGIANSYTDPAVADPDDEIEWLSHPGGGRGHDKMNGKRIKLSDMMGNDSSKWFRLPDGTKTPYPGWFGLPIRHTANCKCDFRKIVKPKKK